MKVRRRRPWPAQQFADLAPLTRFGRNAVDRHFSPAEIRGLLQLTERLAA